MATAKEAPVIRECAWCGQRFVAHYAGARYCSNEHRQAAYRWRRRLARLVDEALFQCRAIAEYLKYSDSREAARDGLKLVRAKTNGFLSRKDG